MIKIRFDRKLKSLAFIVAISTGPILGESIASAGQVTQTASLSTPTISFSGAAGTISFNEFDTLGGTRYLTSVRMFFTANQAGNDVQFTNSDGAVASDISAFWQNSITFTALSGLVNTDTDNLSAGPVNVAANSTSGLVSTSGPALTDDDTIASLLSAYNGTGTFDVGYTRNSNLFMNFNPAVSGSVTPANPYIAASSSLTLEYNYQLVPEPSSLALAGLGAVLLGAVRRFRRR